MICLVACEESQALCKWLRRLGHTAFSCDLQPCSGGYPQWHIVGDCLSLLDGDCEFTTENGDTYCIYGCKWDLIIAHPPCTYLSSPSRGQGWPVLPSSHAPGWNGTWHSRSCNL